MKYLFIDASENLTHIQTGTEKDFKAKTIDTNRDFAAKITEICDSMLAEAGWKQSDLTHLVVCTGPGSLTGLRVADGFLRTMAMLLDKPLIGIDLFTWSMQTVADTGFKGEARFVMPTLIDKAFEVKAKLPEREATEPVLIDKTAIPSSVKTFGVRYGKNDAAEELKPTPEALHKLILEAAPKAKTGMDEILKVLPLYIIPSQAERNFKGGDK